MPKKTEEKVEEKPKTVAKEKTAPPAPEAPVEEKAPEKVVKPKPEKKKKKDKKIFTLFKVESEKVTRLRPTCERCGPGYFMADHGNRYTCGHCGFTKYKPAEK